MLARIIHVKPTFHNKEPPKQYPHLIKNLKKKEILEGNILNHMSIVKCSEIERENRILLEKMSRILHNKNSTIDEVHNQSIASGAPMSLSKIASVKKLMSNIV